MNTVICICTYKRPHMLQALLDALVKLQDAEDVGVCVVDNDIASEGAAVANNLPSDYPYPIYTMVSAQGGISHARNTVVAKALTLKPTFLAFLDDDEQPEPQWLSELLRVQKVTNADVVGGPTLPVFPDGVSEDVKQNPYFGADLNSADEASCQLQAAGNYLIKADVMATMGPTFFHPAFEQSGGEDLAFFTQLGQKGVQMHWAANAIVHEPVPASRLTQSWMRMRIIIIANSRVRVMQICEPGLPAAAIRASKTVALGTVAALTSLLGAIVPSQRQKARMLRWKFWGKLTAHLRITTNREEEY